MQESGPEYRDKLSKHRVPSQLLQTIIMEYMVVQGFSESAKAVASKADPGQTRIVDGRTQVRSAIQEGRVDEAIKELNEIDPAILDENADLFFSLKKQQLIEMIKAGHLEAALKFAQKELSQKAKHHKEFLSELESVMSLMAFEDYNKEAENQLSFAHRQALASKANQAIMKNQSLVTESCLPMYLKLLLWHEKELSKAGASFVQTKSLVNMEF